MRSLLAASAIGRLEPGEEIALRAHLDGCAECRAEARELESVTRSVAARRSRPHRPSRASNRPSTLVRASSIVSRSNAVTNRGARRTRVLAGAGAALLAVAAALVLIFALSTSSSSGGEKVVFPASHGVTGTAKLVARPGGTEVAFNVSGLHDNGEYWLWLTGDDGKRISAGTFRGAGVAAQPDDDRCHSVAGCAPSLGDRREQGGRARRAPLELTFGGAAA